MGFLSLLGGSKPVVPFTPLEEMAHTSRCIFFPDAPRKIRKRNLLMDPQFDQVKRFDKDGNEIPINYKSYKEKLPFCCRKSESRWYLNTYEDMIPIIAERFFHEKRIPPLHNCQFLLPKNATVGQLQVIIKRNMGNYAEMPVYLLVSDQTLPSLIAPLEQLYQAHRDEDGFLYVSYSSEETYG